ncbi:MAG: pectate lyase [Caulobacter sp.]
MLRRSFAAGASLALLLAGTALSQTQAQTPSAAPTRAEVSAAMKRATTFMTDKVATNGGYVWSYLPDFSRRWGEMEAKPTMIWTQAPGTPEMGHVFLDAYHATGDEAYYAAAEQTAEALIYGQHPTGGWNYIIDFGGEASMRDWYETIGKNGWRLEEFQHYYGNATFDDHATIESGKLLLRLYLEKHDPRWRPALEKAIGFVLESQYPNGGWPQRYPRAGEFSNHGKPDYTGYVTFNDEVLTENVGFLLMVYQTLGDARVLDPLSRAMNVVVASQHGQPTPGWSLQYTVDLKPAGARTYEPRSIATHTTAANVSNLMDFYELTGETKYLARIPEALTWLDSIELPKAKHTRDGRTHFTHYDPETNTPIYVHRRGSNAQNGEYYVGPAKGDEMGQRNPNTKSLWARYRKLVATPPAQASKNSILKAKSLRTLPRFWVTDDIVGSDLNMDTSTTRASDDRRTAQLIADLNTEGYWPTELRTTSHPYRGDGPATPPPGFKDRGQVGDAWDTSPFTEPTGPMGISTGTYIRNMSILIQHLEASR